MNKRYTLASEYCEMEPYYDLHSAKLTIKNNRIYWICKFRTNIGESIRTLCVSDNNRDINSRERYLMRNHYNRILDIISAFIVKKTFGGYDLKIKDLSIRYIGVDSEGDKNVAFMIKDVGRSEIVLDSPIEYIDNIYVNGEDNKYEGNIDYKAINDALFYYNAAYGK